MNLRAFLLTLSPLFLLAGIALLSFLLNVNGLYSAGSPFSWLAFAASAWLLERSLNILTHGSRADSRWMFVGLAFALSPVFIKTGLLDTSNAPVLALTLAAFFFALHRIEYERDWDAVPAAVFMSLAVSIDMRLAALFVPLALSLGRVLADYKKWKWLMAALLSGVAVFLFVKTLAPNVFLPETAWAQWSPANFFRRSFSGESHFFPNIVYVLSPLMHPFFCVLLPGLFLLAKKTDMVLPAKKVVLLCIGSYLLLIAGFPQQDLQCLLPAYALLLLLFFPAWDRLFCYGFYFFKPLTWSVLGLIFLLQVFFTGYLLLAG